MNMNKCHTVLWLSMAMVSAGLLGGCMPESNDNQSIHRVEPTEEADIVLPPEELAELKARSPGIVSNSALMHGRPRSSIQGSNYLMLATEAYQAIEREFDVGWAKYQNFGDIVLTRPDISCPDEGKYIFEITHNTDYRYLNSTSVHQGGDNCVRYRKKWVWLGWFPQRVIVGKVHYHGLKSETLSWNDTTWQLSADDLRRSLSPLPLEAYYLSGISQVEPPRVTPDGLKDIAEELRNKSPEALLVHDPSNPELIHEVQTVDLSKWVDNEIADNTEHPDLSFAIQNSDVRIDMDKKDMRGFLEIWIANQTHIEYTNELETATILNDEGEMVTEDIMVVHADLRIPAYSYEAKLFDGTAKQMVTAPFSVIDGKRVSIKANNVRKTYQFNHYLDQWTVAAPGEGELLIYGDGQNFIDATLADDGMYLRYYETTPEGFPTLENSAFLPTIVLEQP